MSRTCEYGQWLLRVGGIVQIWNRKFKKYCKKLLRLLQKLQRYQKEI